MKQSIKSEMICPQRPKPLRFWLPALVAVLATVAVPFAASVRAQAPEPKKPHDIVELSKPAARLIEGVNQVPAVVAERPLAPLEPAGKRIYHGVCINAEDPNYFSRALAKYEELVGHKPAVLVQFAHAYDAEKPLDWDYHAEVLRTIDRHGLIPFIKATTQTWDPRVIGAKGFYFKADDILAGKHDAFFAKAARVCRDFGKPMFICWNHEMNGDWYTYSENFAKVHPEVPSDWTAEKYIQFHRKVWQIFQDEGATNAVFTFAPVLVGRKIGPYDEAHGWKAYYPGDKYVDWLVPSFYNEVTPETFDAMASETNMPIFPSEWGSCVDRVKWYNPKPYPGDAAWVTRTMELWMQRYPNLKGSAYFQWDTEYEIQRVPEQLEGYRRALDDPMFIHGPATELAAELIKQGGAR